METNSVVLTFESANEVLWRDHLNEICSYDICVVPFVFIILQNKNLESFFLIFIKRVKAL